MLLSSVQTKSRIFQLLPSQQEGWRGTRSWEGTQPGQLTQTGQRDISYHVTSCPIYKLGGVGLWGVGLGGITAQELTGGRLASGEQLHCASLVLYIQFFYYYYRHFIVVIIIIISFFLSVLLNCSYLNPRVLLFLPILSPISLGQGD